MSFDRRRALAVLAPGAALGAWLVLGALVLRAMLAPDQRAALAPLVSSHGALVLGWWLAAAALGAWAAGRLYELLVASPARLADAARLLVDDPVAPPLAPAGSDPVRTLAEAVNRLADQRRSLRADMAGLVEDASRKVALERDQLGGADGRAAPERRRLQPRRAGSCSTTAAPAPSSAGSRSPPTAPGAPS